MSNSRPSNEASVVAGPSDTENVEVNLSGKASGSGFPDPQGAIDITVMQVDYTLRKSGGGSEKPIIHVYGRNNDNEVEHVIIHGFRPYFYIPNTELQDLETWKADGTESVNFNSLRGTPVTRVYTETPPQVRYMTDDFDRTFEADIDYSDRFLIDNGIKSGMRIPERRRDDGTIVIRTEEVEPVHATASPRVNMFDIEVEDRNGFPEDGVEPIICITSWDSVLDEYVLWYYESPNAEAETPDGLDDYEPIAEETDFRVLNFQSEEEMLYQFIEYIRETDADVLTGWNFDDFDAPYLIDRLEILNEDSEQNLDIDRLSRLGDTWNGYNTTIKGRIVFDLLEAYKRTQFSELDSYRLDAVAEVELGIGKEHYHGDIGDLWEQNPEKLMEYSLRDVELLVELDKKEEIMDFWDEVRTFVGCNLGDAPIPSDAVDMYFLQKVHGRFALPSKGQAEEEDYEGGAVFDPISGVAPNVTVLDLKSLYPMCMVTINASPETKVEDPENYDGETFRSPPIAVGDGDREPIHFRKKPDGIIREVIDELLEEREKKKSKRNSYDPSTDEYAKFDQQQAAIKVIMNSTYGVLGWERFRLYDKDMGAAVTATGRGVINYSEDTVENMGYDVTYGDTDSVMISLGDTVTPNELDGDIDAHIGDDEEIVTVSSGEHEVKMPKERKEAFSEMDDEELVTVESAIARSFEMEDVMNESYDDFATEELNADEHRFQIEFEKLYRRFFQAGKKKRYAGHIVWKEGKNVDKLDVTGFEYKRSDISPITKEVQKKVLSMIVRGVPEEDIREYIHEIITDFRAGEYSITEFGMPGGIGQPLDEYDTDTAQVRGAKYSNLMLGTNFASGSKPKRVYLDKVHPKFFRENDFEFETTEEQKLYARFKKEQDVICFEFEDTVPEEFQPDLDKMLDKTLRGPIERVIESVDIPWEDVRSGQNQSGLGQFM